MSMILNHWNWDTGSILLWGVLLLVYGYLQHFKKRDKGGWMYLTGATLMLVLQSSPLHFLGMHYLLSAFMILHIVLLLVCGPLMVIGLPMKGRRTKSLLLPVSAFFRQYPWIGWLSGIGLMWFWHIPVVFDAVFPDGHGSNGFRLLPFLHCSSLLFGGIAFAWPVLGPYRSLRIHPLLGVLYLFTACIACSSLGLLLTFISPTTYTHYYMADDYGLSEIIRSDWGMNHSRDQQVAGLLMWVPCCFIYLSGAMVLVYRWLNHKPAGMEKAGSITPKKEPKPLHI